MIRFTVLCSVAVLLIALPAEAQKPLKSPAARKAQTAYRAALSKAKAEYKAELLKAKLRAKSSADAEEEARIAAELASLDDPLAAVRRKILGGKFYLPNGVNLQLLPNAQWKSTSGSTGTWVLTDQNTLVQQSYKSSAIVVWKFDKSYRKVTCYRFKRSSVKPYTLKRK